MQKIVVYVLLGMSLAAQSFAGTTGKVSGVVTDGETGEALPGANIIIEGSTMGAASDMQGRFTILNIPPGVYVVKASFLGYAAQSRSAVRVLIDRTIRLNFELIPQALQTEEITIVAEQEMVRQDVSSSLTNISAEEMLELPLNDLAKVIELQAGIEKGMTIRGSSIEQSDFLIDGFSLRDERNNEPITTALPMAAIEDMAVMSGGFNAEYGLVRSGIVNSAIKEGKRSSYTGSLNISASPPGKKHFGLSPFDRNSFWLRPYFDDAVAFTGTENGGWDKHTRRQYPRFVGWNEISRRTLANNDPTDDLSPSAAQRLFAWQHRKEGAGTKTDYNVDLGFGGPVPFIGKKLGGLRFFTAFRKFQDEYLVPLSRDAFTNYSWLMKLTSSIKSNMKLSITSLLGQSAGTSSDPEAGAHSFQSVEDVAGGLADGYFRNTRMFSNSFFSNTNTNYGMFSAKFTHTLNASSFYEISLRQTRKKYSAGPVALRNTEATNEIFPGYFVNEAPFGYVDASVDGIAGLMMGGHIGEARDFSEIVTTSAGSKYTTQLNSHNEITAGFELTHTSLDLEYGGKNSQFPTLVSWNEVRETPLRASLHLQDKLEFDGFVANLGMRLDYSDPNTQWIATDPYNRTFFSDKYRPAAESGFDFKAVKPRLTWSPRVGIAHPISSTAKFYFNYGHFRQLPSAEGIYELRRTGLNQLVSIGDPTLDLEKTVAYELGYEQELFSLYLLQLSAYYKDISAQRSYVHYVDITEKVNYWKEESNNYEDIRGLEVTLRKRGGRWFSGFANYTYMVSSSGYFGFEQLFENPAEQRDFNAKNPQQWKPVPQPYARVNLDLHVPENFGPEIAGLRPLQDWRMNLLYNWRSGWWDTWNPNDRAGVINNIQWADFHNFNVRLSKPFKMKKLNLIFFADINNLFNTKRFSGFGFYDFQDRRDYFDSLHMPKNVAAEIGSVFIPGDDRPGDYRKTGVDFVSLRPIGSIDVLTNPADGQIYYDMATGNYMEFVGQNWSEVNGSRIKRILDDKAYIDMPNMSSFTFLNPRDIFIGLKLSFNY